MDEFRRMMEPLSVIEENREMLFKYYVANYGKENEKIIENRFDKTLYLLSSRPDYTYNYLVYNQRYITDWEYFDEIENYYYDFIKQNKICNEEAEKNLFNLFCEFHKISKSFYASKREEIITLAEKIELDKDLNEEYELIGVEPLKNREDLTNFIKIREKIDDDYIVTLVSESLWGKDLKLSFLDMGLNLSFEVLSFILNLKETTAARCFNFKSFILCYIPVIYNFLCGGDVDRVFFHENRHAIECGKFVGICNKESNLDILNEIRTEKHAIEDNQNLPTLFSKKINANINYYYETLFEYCGNIFEEYRYIFDDCAFNNDLDKIFKIFGKQDYCNFERLINKKYKKKKEFIQNGLECLEVDVKDALNLVDKLKATAKKNGYLPYQKIKK